MNSLLYYFCKTFKDIFANSSILTTLILSVVFYSFFYPTAYQAQQAQSIPIVIVDEEQSPMTSAIIGQVTQSPNVEIKAITTNFLDAEQMVQHQQADGTWPRDALNGVFFCTAMLNYRLYNCYFPTLALAKANLH